jgi:6-phosphofructo-2-kinase
MTRSKVSPDGRIPDRDVAAKLVIIMVGLPARGKSYITKKIQRYLSWQQHNTRIFNVGNRRRIAAGVIPSSSSSPRGRSPPTSQPHQSRLNPNGQADAPVQEAASILLNGTHAAEIEEPTTFDLNGTSEVDNAQGEQRRMDQSAKFFDPKNETASKIREQVALETLDELIDYLLHGNGSVGVLDATNSTLHRRQLLVDRIKEREPKLGILFIESICNDENVSGRHCF